MQQKLDIIIKNNKYGLINQQQEFDEWAWVNDLSGFDESMEKAIAELRQDQHQERDWECC